MGLRLLACNWGPSTSKPRGCDRFVTHVMADGRYESRWGKHSDPDFVASAASGGPSTNPHAGSNKGADDEIFDAALEKGRKHRRDIKNNTNKKLDKLVDVAGRLEFVEEVSAEVANGKAPEGTLLRLTVRERH